MCQWWFLCRANFSHKGAAEHSVLPRQPNNKNTTSGRGTAGSLLQCHFWPPDGRGLLNTASLKMRSDL